MADKPDSIGIWADVEFLRPTVLRQILAAAQFCTFPEGMEPDSEQMMKAVEKVGGFYVTGEQVNKENLNGVWIFRPTIQLLIPWRFVHTMIVGSAEQVKKFGFDKK